MCDARAVGWRIETGDGQSLSRTALKAGSAGKEARLTNFCSHRSEAGHVGAENERDATVGIENDGEWGVALWPAVHPRAG